MSETQDKVYKAIKRGSTNRAQIKKATGMTLGQIHNALRRLRKWGLIKIEDTGTYSIGEKGE